MSFKSDGYPRVSPRVSGSDLSGIGRARVAKVPEISGRVPEISGTRSSSTMYRAAPQILFHEFSVQRPS